MIPFDSTYDFIIQNQDNDINDSKTFLFDMIMHHTIGIDCRMWNIFQSSNCSYSDHCKPFEVSRTITLVANFLVDFQTFSPIHKLTCIQWKKIGKLKLQKFKFKKKFSTNNYEDRGWIFHETFLVYWNCFGTEEKYLSFKNNMISCGFAEHVWTVY